MPSFTSIFNIMELPYILLQYSVTMEMVFEVIVLRCNEIDFAASAKWTTYRWVCGDDVMAAW